MPLLLLASMIPACASVQAQSTSATPEDLASVRSEWAEGLRLGDGARVAAVYLIDGADASFGAATAEGQAAIRESFGRFLDGLSKQSLAVQRIEFLPNEVRGFGEIRLERGRFELRLEREEMSTLIASGHYVFVAEWTESEWRLRWSLLRIGGSHLGTGLLLRSQGGFFPPHASASVAAAERHFAP